ncbi:MAG: hypothetical protein KatS3mg128_1204 [Silanimonas sp.]|nr:MAG: hypothetical protein KatS3mg128_1204 [Silanimonas sp.]
MSAGLLARWVEAHGGSPALARWAAALALAEARGHTALDLTRARAEDSALDPAALEAPGWVGTGALRTPFVREGEQRLYLWRHWQAEARVAAALAARAREPDTGPLAPEAVEALFGGPGDGRDAAQREAVRRCGEARLFVLTGGPGTGKTTTVLRMLLARQRQLGSPPRVRVAAPTGKAAQRLVEAMREGRAGLASALAGSAWETALAGFTLPEASTLHRLLGYQPARHRFARDARDPIEADLVVVDEASMLDLAQLDALLAALPPATPLWLVGDAEQLSPVGPGSALQDLVQALEARPGAPLVRLRHSFRADSQLAALNTAIASGEAGASLAALSASPALALRPLAGPAALEAALRDWVRPLAEALRAPPLPADPAAAREAARAALAGLRQRQWLCATREGPRGSQTVAARLDTLLRRALAGGSAAEAGPHYPGRPLIITRNDPDSGLFNGDVGLCLLGADGRLRAWFDTGDGPRAFPLGALPAHAPACALTVHKSQGSEYGTVAVLLPEDPQHPLLSRELLYTAASRARHVLTLHASEAVLRAGVGRPVQRSGGLRERLTAQFGASAGGKMP